MTLCRLRSAVGVFVVSLFDEDFVKMALHIVKMVLHRLAALATQRWLEVAGQRCFQSGRATRRTPATPIYGLTP